MAKTSEELLRLLTDLETNQVERKAVLKRGAQEHTCDAICAFANDLPDHRTAGVLSFGGHQAAVRVAADDFSALTDRILHEVGLTTDPTKETAA